MPNCPPEITLLDYFEDKLTSKKKEEAYNHLLNRKDCLEALAQAQNIPPVINNQKSSNSEGFTFKALAILSPYIFCLAGKIKH